MPKPEQSDPMFTVATLGVLPLPEDARARLAAWCGRHGMTHVHTLVFNNDTGQVTGYAFATNEAGLPYADKGEPVQADPVTFTPTAPFPFEYDGDLWTLTPEAE